MNVGIYTRSSMLASKVAPRLGLSHILSGVSCSRLTTIPVSIGVRLLSTDPRPDRRTVLGQKILDKVPRFLKPYTIDFISKPVANLTSFLILHELSAIIPLIGFWWLFHKYQFLIPLDLPQWAIDKGTKIIDDSLKSFDFNGFTLNDKFKIISEGAYAFVLVKMLLPVRLIFSFALTPVFSKYITSPIGRLFQKRNPPATTPIAKDQIGPIKSKKIDKPRL